MSDVKAGMEVVCGTSGVRVTTPMPAGGVEQEVFGFMESDVSSEKPQTLLVRQVAYGFRSAKAAGKEGAVGRRSWHRSHRGGTSDDRDGRGWVRRHLVRRQRAGNA
jgi:hypothetical protein